MGRIREVVETHRRNIMGSVVVDNITNGLGERVISHWTGSRP